jgi:3-isopropylmalate dehydratase small subunit
VSMQIISGGGREHASWPLSSCGVHAVRSLHYLLQLWLQFPP